VTGPAFPLVEMKLQPPAREPGIVDRTRLIALLMQNPEAPIVSIVAPPGYGKTTLVSQWMARLRRPVAWLTLDDHDNDPAVLLSYLAAALARVGPIPDAVWSTLVAPRGRMLAAALPRLLSEVASWERPAVLILDDVHRIGDTTALDVLAGLADHWPRGSRVVLSGRAAPGLPLGRFRVQRELLEIGPDLLALDETEVRALTEALGHRCSLEEIRSLTERTEGWAAAVYLASLAHERHADAAPVEISVSGKDRFITEYIRSELMEGLAREDVRLLTRTSVLEMMTPPLVEAVSGLPRAERRLTSLAQRSLLIQAGGQTAATFRYHHLLRDFLRDELGRLEPGTEPELHRRAATWYAAAGDVVPAVDHAIASGDTDEAARLITAATLPTFYGGRSATVDHWIQSLDTQALAHHPPLAVIAGWMHLLNGRAEDADRMADIAERTTLSGPPGDGSASFESQRAMLRAIMARRGPQDVLDNAQLSVAQEPPESFWRANALWLLGSAHRLLGDAQAADAAFADAVAAGAASGGTSAVAMAYRAIMAIERSDWSAAGWHVRESQVELVKARFEEILPSLIVYAVEVRVAIQRGERDRARKDLVRAQIVRPLASHAAPWFAVEALLQLARAHLALADTAGAQLVVREAEQIARQRPQLGILTTSLHEMRQQLADASGALSGSSTLTAAELRLLPLLPTYLSFQDIADRLLVSRNTVKTHALSIYGKLQASSRGEAVERAVEIGLLEPYPALEATARPQPDG
jgi:LuxR family transcriptional regulator, maltose regulon positive regulatory protein